MKSGALNRTLNSRHPIFGPVIRLHLVVMGLSELEQAVCDSLAERRARLYADLEEQVAISTGRNYQPGLDRLRLLVSARLNALGRQPSRRLPEPRALARATLRAG